MDAFRGRYDKRTPVVNKARMYIYDAEMMQQARSMNDLNTDTVATLSASLTTHNSWIRQYKSILLDLNNNDVSVDNVGIEFAQVTTQTIGSVIGDAPPPTAKGIAALISKTTPKRAHKDLCTLSPVPDRTIYAAALGLSHCGALLTNHFNNSLLFFNE